MTITAKILLLVLTFGKGIYFGMWLERRHQRRLRRAEVWRPSRGVFCEIGSE